MRLYSRGTIFYWTSACAVSRTIFDNVFSHVSHELVFLTISIDFSIRNEKFLASSVNIGA